MRTPRFTLRTFFVAMTLVAFAIPLWAANASLYYMYVPLALACLTVAYAMPLARLEVPVAFGIAAAAAAISLYGALGFATHHSYLTREQPLSAAPPGAAC